MLKRYISWLKDNQKKPIVTMLIMVVVATAVTVILNLVEGKSIISNMDFVLFLIIMYSGSWFMNKYIHHTWLQLALSFCVAFILLTLQMFSDGSYVDYTSFIVNAGVAVFLALIMLIVTKSLSK
ncbi:transporter [Leuconostoc pseudomesenteroides]|uniref:transporter n=1 Tax=Leuconostoc pseudomesenteroides TaxID=33968 RepID=UPI00301BFC2A